ncbi:hypothetical protein C8A01DRAFT_47252 [Parachaetomium inaequale]|uniref:DUF7820 domain-containing protein n=1 Tax=Parachaetomium inaequale TaxID=2588326 RepID=A0AAN6PFU9_9PEZI|nr:hypothetical protein C8A01DRAFT_47252 [Parachaetomium inaequale]
MEPEDNKAARTLSMATSSTMPMSESSYRGPRGPSHPYGLYPQNDSIEPDAVQAAAIPLGFRGLPDQYQRRVGPEGEEVGDMIGPDGHQEQLPPYSRYPDEAYVRKAVAVDGSPDAVHGAAVVSPILTTSASAIPTIHGAGGIGLATRNPEFESTDDLDSPRSRHSTRSFTSDDSGRRIRLDDEGISEKREPPKKWQAWMRRKVCGIIPYWAMCLTAIVLVVMMVVLGAVIGTFAANKQKRPPRKDGAWQPPYDATPIPPPPDLQPLATGTFGLPLMTNRVSNTCFANPTLSQAWNCHLVISGMTLRVTKEKDDYLASLDCNHSFTMMNNVYSYGEQPPLIPKPVTLDLVEDKFEPSRGPAWFQAVSFNKTVILPEGWLGSSGGDSKKMARHAASIGTSISNFKRKGIAQPGDKPWTLPAPPPPPPPKPPPPPPPPPPFNTETSTSTSTATATSSNPFGPIDTGNDFPPLPQPYPRVIKLEERRVSTQGAPRAQCTQIEIRGPGEEARPFLGPDGRPVVVDIDESEPFGPPPAGGRIVCKGRGERASELKVLGYAL